MGGPDMAPQPPQRSEHPCSAVGAPRYSDRLLALLARFFDVEHLWHRLRRDAQLEPVDRFQPIEDRLDAPSGLEDFFDPPASGGVHLLSEQLRLAHHDGQRIVDLVRGRSGEATIRWRSEEHTSELQSPCNLVCRLLLEKKKKTQH